MAETLQNGRIHYSTFFKNWTYFVEHFEALASFFVSCWYCLFKCIKRGCFWCHSNQLLEVRLISLLGRQIYCSFQQEFSGLVWYQITPVLQSIILSVCMTFTLYFFDFNSFSFFDFDLSRVLTMDKKINKWTFSVSV